MPVNGAQSPPNSTAHELFDALWNTMANILGTAATATLLRRAAKRGVPLSAGLSTLSIRHDGLTYCYVVPGTWDIRSDPAAVGALCVLAQALRPLLMEMTGLVVLRRLAQVTALHRIGFTLLEEAQA
jgi:hypothetical protein